VEGGWPQFGVGAEICARIMEGISEKLVLAYTQTIVHHVPEYKLDKEIKS
jgi:hypothetical protein